MWGISKGQGKDNTRASKALGLETEILNMSYHFYCII